MTVAPLISFREYVTRVVNDPKRKDELKTLLELFGQLELERIMEGKSKASPLDAFRRKVGGR